MRELYGTNLEWVGSFLAIFLPQCREALEDIKERWNDPCMENGDTSGAAPSTCWREASCRPSVRFPGGGAECLLRRQRMSCLSL